MRTISTGFTRGYIPLPLRGKNAKQGFYGLPVATVLSPSGAQN
jgi:hypothetical protein